MKKHLLIIVIFISSLSAQVLTLQECIDKTFKNHPDIKSFMLEVSRSEYNKKAVSSAYLPQVNLQAQYDVQHTYVLPQNGQFNTLDDQGWQAEISLRQKIWDFYKTTSKIDVAQIDTQIANLSVDEAKALMIYKIQSLYETALVQKEAIYVRLQDTKTKKELYNQAHAFVEQGIKTTSDETRFLSAYYGAKDALGVAEASYEKALSSLWLYMGEKRITNVELETNILNTTTITTNAQQLSDEMFYNNTELKIYEQNIQKSNLLHKSAKASSYGSIDAVASYTHFDTLNEYDASLVGVVYNLPIYTGGNQSAEEQMASISTSISKELKNSKFLALNEELESLIIDLKSYENTIIAKKSQIEASTSTKELVDARYKEGLATYIEVLDATDLQLASQLDLLEAHYNRSMAQHRIKYLIGKEI
ncbi:TolC family protein [Sulfurimonas sp. CS5]|uniref:TolC family protein n=1 Tax=Sulfurimonas sp. CS5 TaxID=3391145 RepID=UPI0039EC81D3